MTLHPRSHSNKDRKNHRNTLSLVSTMFNPFPNKKWWNPQNLTSNGSSPGRSAAGELRRSILGSCRWEVSLWRSVHLRKNPKRKGPSFHDPLTYFWGDCTCSRLIGKYGEGNIKETNYLLSRKIIILLWANKGQKQPFAKIFSTATSFSIWKMVHQWSPRISGPSFCGQFAFSALFASSWSPAQA